jgi:hypothetical protein
MQKKWRLAVLVLVSYAVAQQPPAVLQGSWIATTGPTRYLRGRWLAKVLPRRKMQPLAPGRFSMNETKRFWKALGQLGKRRAAGKVLGQRE